MPAMPEASEVAEHARVQFSGVPGVRCSAVPIERWNKTEAAFADYLNLAPDIVWWAFEGVKLRLANRTWYTPDFYCLNEKGQIIIYEVKGYWRDDARVKIKVAAETYPWFRFWAVSKKKGGWQFEMF